VVNVLDGAVAEAALGVGDKSGATCRLALVQTHRTNVKDCRLKSAQALGGATSRFTSVDVWVKAALIATNRIFAFHECICSFMLGY
jgi:hypothetical protein